MLLMKDIVFDDNPILRERSVEVEFPVTDEDRKTIIDMHDFLVNSQDEAMIEKYGLRPGVGIAAVQLGILKKMFALLIYNYDEDGNVTDVAASYALVNPRIISHSVKKTYLSDGEGCLSVENDHQGYVPRYNKITLHGYDVLTDSFVQIVAKGYLAIVIQHELDHFEGILFYDRINKDNPFGEIENSIAI